MKIFTIITVAQIIVSLLLIVLVLLQERSAGMSGIFGGDGGGFYQTRRGLEKVAFLSTIVCAVVFAALSIAQLFLH